MPIYIHPSPVLPKCIYIPPSHICPTMAPTQTILYFLCCHLHLPSSTSHNVIYISHPLLPTMSPTSSILYFPQCHLHPPASTSHNVTYILHPLLPTMSPTSTILTLHGELASSPTIGHDLHVVYMQILIGLHIYLNIPGLSRFSDKCHVLSRFSHFLGQILSYFWAWTDKIHITKFSRVPDSAVDPVFST